MRVGGLGPIHVEGGDGVVGRGGDDTHIAAGRMRRGPRRCDLDVGHGDIAPVGVARRRGASTSIGTNSTRGGGLAAGGRGRGCRRGRAHATNARGDGTRGHTSRGRRGRGGCGGGGRRRGANGEEPGSIAVDRRLPELRVDLVDKVGGVGRVHHTRGGPTRTC